MGSLGRLVPQEGLCPAYLRERGPFLLGHNAQGQVVFPLLDPLLRRKPGLGVCLDSPLRQDLLCRSKRSRSRPGGLGLGTRAGELPADPGLARVVRHRPHPAFPAT